MSDQMLFRQLSKISKFLYRVKFECLFDICQCIRMYVMRFSFIFLPRILKIQNDESKLKIYIM